MEQAYLQEAVDHPRIHNLYINSVVPTYLPNYLPSSMDLKINRSFRVEFFFQILLLFTLAFKYFWILSVVMKTVIMKHSKTSYLYTHTIVLT